MRVSYLLMTLEIKEEKLEEYTSKLVEVLKKTSLIIDFTHCLHLYMPKYNELKHFNAENIAASYE